MTAAVNDGDRDFIVARARRASEGFRAVSRVIWQLNRMLPLTDEGMALVEAQAAVEKAFNALVLLTGPAFGDEVRRLESEVVRLEQLTEALDREIPMGWFREHFDASQSSSVALADYVALLGRYASDSPLRLDRIQFLLTRLVSFFMSPQDESPTRRRELLAEALPPMTVSASAREGSVTFLRDAAARVKTFKRLKEVIDSDFFVDIRGYKLSLRTQILDPDVMAAAIELNEAVNDNLHRLAVADTPEGQELEAHLAEVDRHIKSIFTKLREDETATQQNFERWLARNAEKRAAKARASEGKPRRKKDTFDGSLHLDVKVNWSKTLFGVFAVLLIVTIARWPSPNALVELGKDDLQSLSPLIVQGTAAPARKPRILVGQVDKARWALLSLEKRTEAARELARAIKARGWVAATVLMEEQVVIQIEHTQVLLVQ